MKLQPEKISLTDHFVDGDDCVDIRLDLCLHSGHRITSSTGWEVLNLSFTWNNRHELTVDRRASFQVKDPFELMLDLRIWLMRFRDEAVQELLMPVLIDRMVERKNPDSLFLRAMLRLDDQLRTLEKTQPDK